MGATAGEAVEDNLIALLARGRERRGAEFHDGVYATWFRSGIRIDSLNAVLRARFPSEEAEDRAREILAGFQAAALPFVWTVGPTSRPQRLPGVLERLGLADLGETAAMALDLAAWSDDRAAPADVRVSRVTDAAGLDKFVHAYVIGNGFPPEDALLWRDGFAALGAPHSPQYQQLAAERNGRVVATASLHVDGRTAGVYDVAVLAPFRGRGYGRAVTAASLRAALELGYETAVLIASRGSEPLYRSMGFEDVAVVRTFRWPRP